jgi:fumarate reductase flavoprotein subunit
VRTDHTGQSATLKGLFAAGEAACWDMHGFNRLGGNSVAETVVAGMIVGEYVADYCDRLDSEADIPTSLVHEFLRREQARIDTLVNGRGTEDASAIKARMQDLMTAKVGIFRRGEDLQAAVDELQQLLVKSRNIGLRDRSPGANPELVTAYRVQRMLKVALCIAYGALVRTESRGAHFRQDFPRRNDAEWLKRTLAVWKGEADTLPTLSWEALDVNAMELPPGWRGYGAKDYVDHPDTARRAAEVDALKQKMGGATRYAVQQALMPYDAMLPECYRGRNERIDEPFEMAKTPGAEARGDEAWEPTNE